jgi:hypothetical protein
MIERLSFDTPARNHKWKLISDDQKVWWTRVYVCECGVKKTHHRAAGIAYSINGIVSSKKIPCLGSKNPL